jgi:hypothetical protein
VLKRLASVFAGSAVAAAATAAAPQTSDASTTAENYGQYSLMFQRPAGQYFAGGTAAGQWAWTRQPAPLHPYALQLSRTVEIAKGLGMAFTNRTTVPVSWNADGRNYWHY